MLEKNAIYSGFIKKFPSLLLLIGIFILNVGTAQALTADDVLNKMDSKQQTAFVGGVVGGFAYMRWLRDRPDETGMACINNWFYGTETDTWKRIDLWFSRHLDKQAEPLLYVLIKKECGE